MRRGGGWSAKQKNIERRGGANKALGTGVQESLGLGRGYVAQREILVKRGKDLRLVETARALWNRSETLTRICVGNSFAGRSFCQPFLNIFNRLFYFSSGAVALVFAIGDQREGDQEQRRFGL